MSDTVTIPVRTMNNIERTVNRLRVMMEERQKDELISEDDAASFLEVGVGRLRNMVYDGTIPKTAYVTLVNGKRKFKKDKLIKD